MNTLTRHATPAAWPRRLRFALLAAGWRAAARVAPWRPAALFHLGNLCFAQDRRDAALDAWRRAADTRRGHAKALHNLGQALVADQRWREAAAVCRRLAGSAGDVASAYQAGKCHMAAGDAGAARTDFEACVQLDPTHVGALEHLGRLALARRDGASASAWLGRALPHAAQPGAIHFLLGVAAELQRDHRAAAEHYAQVQDDALRAQAQQRLARLQPRPRPAVPPSTTPQEQG